VKQNNKYKSTRVISGKRVQPPTLKPTLLTNADFLRGGLYGLYALRQEQNNYINSNIQYNNQCPNTLTSNQIKYLTDLFKGIVCYLNHNSLLNPSNHKFTKKIREATTDFDNLFKAYKSQLPTQKLPHNLKKACAALFDFVKEYVNSFFFTDGLIADIRKIPNRPADFTLRQLVDNIIRDYQIKQNTSELPKYPYVIKALNKNRAQLTKIQLSARQYGNFKIWRDRGTYWWYIQP